MICIRLVLGITKRCDQLSFYPLINPFRFSISTCPAHCNSASLLSQRSSSPVAHPHPSSIHTSRWTSSLRESPPCGCCRCPPAARCFHPCAGNSWLSLGLQASHPR